MCLLVATLIVLRLLSLNFPDEFTIVLSHHILITLTPEQYASPLSQAVEFCQDIFKRRPNLLSSLHIGISVEDTIDKILDNCT